MRLKIYILFLITSIVFFGCRKDGIEPINSSYFIKYFGEGVHDGIYKVKQTSDNGYLMVGYTQENSTELSTRDAYVIKVNALGILEWKKILGGDGFDELRDVLVVDDGYVFIGTNEDTLESIRKDVYILKLDFSGKEIWNYTYGGKENQQGNALAQLQSGNIVFVGSTTTAGNITQSNGQGVNPAGTKDSYIGKIPSTGQPLLDSFQFGSKEEDEFVSINVKDNSNEIYCTGTMDYNDGQGLDNKCIVVCKFEPGLTIALDPNYYGSSGLDGSSFSFINSSKLLFLGSKNDNSEPFVDVIHDLNDLSSTSVDDFDFDFPTTGNVVINSADKSGNGFILAGSTDGEGNGGKDILLIKINSEAVVEWSQTYGGEGDDIGISVDKTSDGGLLLEPLLPLEQTRKSCC